MHIIYVLFVLFIVVICFLELHFFEARYRYNSYQASKNAKNNQRNRQFIFLILSLPMGMCQQVSDRLVYIDDIITISHYGLGTVALEYPYQVLMWGVSKIISNPNWILFWLTQISMFFFFKSLNYLSKYYKYEYLFLGFVSSIYPWGYIEIRAFLACGIASLAIRYLVEKKPVHYCAIIMISTLFHNSMIILLPFILFRKIKGHKNIIILTALTGCILFFRNQILSFLICLPVIRKYEYYLGFIKEMGISINGYVIFFLPIFIICAYILCRYNNTYNKEKNAIYYSGILMFVLTFLMGNPLIYRIIHILYIFFPIILAELIESKIVKEMKLLILPYSLILLSSFFYMGDYELIPFRFFWS